MLRKSQTRASQRRNYLHENDGIQYSTSNDIIRPPTSHPYSGYKSKKSESQMRLKYSPNFFLESKLELNRIKGDSKANVHSYQVIDKLPQNFKLAVNQLRVFLKNKEILSPLDNSAATFSQFHGKEFDDLLVNLAKIINDLVYEKDLLAKMNENLERNIEDLNTKIYEREKKSNHLYHYQGEAHKFYKKENMQSGYKKEQEILLENARLGDLNMKYLARIAELESTKTEKYVETQNSKESESKTDTELLRCHNRISYLEMKLSTAEKLEHDMEITKERLERELAELKERMLEVNLEVKIRTERLNEWRERAMMQKEDGEIHISRQQFLLYSLKKLRENNKNLLNKLLTVYKPDEKMKKDLLQSPNFEYEIDFFKSIKSSYQNGKLEKPFTQNEVRKNELGLDIEDITEESDYHNYKKTDSFDVSSLRYFRPSFFSFLEESANPETIQSRNKVNTSVSRVFIQILRSIMSSKLNEMMFVDCPEKFSRFPEFVYGWFEKFYFNTEKNTVCALEPFMQKPMSQEIFYKDLMNVKLDQSWEIITFREFILEELSLEELYFYLMCQNLLFSRAGITKEIQCYGDFCLLVEYSAAKSVLDLTLNDFESWNITFLTSKLREKIVIKKSKEYIEAGFFLRCLLEYYKIERSNRYRYISKICSEFQDKKGLRFSSFMSVINKFTEVSTEIKLKLYRDCFCLSRGVITPESIFIVCSEEMIFLKHLKMKSFYRLPKIIQKPVKLAQTLSSSSSEISKPMKQILCLQPPDPYLYEIIIGFNRLIYSDCNILKLIESLGVTDFNQQYLSIVRALDDRSSEIGSHVLKCKHFLHYFSNSIEIVRKMTFSNLYDLLEEESKKRANNFWIQFSDEDLGTLFVKEMTATFETYKKINDLKNWKNEVYQFRLNLAAKKIQRQVKKKFIEPYQEMYNYFNKEKPDQTEESKA